jgi:hypothetical protein
VRSLDTSSKVHFHSSFLFLPDPFDRTFSPYRLVPHSHLFSTEGRFPGTPVRPRERPNSHLDYSISSQWSETCSGHTLTLTARQYGEVVLPDASTGQGPGTLASKLSRCKEGMARVFAVQVQILLSITRVAVQFVSEPDICQCAGFKLRADERVRVQQPLQICLRCRSKSKNRDKQLTHIVRVRACCASTLCHLCEELPPEYY